MGVIYGKVNNAEDVRRINCIIRDEMLVVETEEQLIDLKKRSDYLCTLTYSPFWKKKFWPMIDQLRQVAYEENRITVRLANYISKYKGWEKQFDAWWDDDLTIEEKLKELPEEVVKEISESTLNLQLSPEILEEIRRSFCKIRAGMVMVETEIQLTALKKQSDLLVAIVKTTEFRKRFEDVLDKIDELVEKEEERTIQLANIISEVNEWKVNYEKWSEDQIAEWENIDTYVERLLKEEEKAETYIPTEARYPGGKTMWLIYKHPVRNREYAKRIYFSGNVRNIVIDWPGVFENKFGRKVFGVKITYETLVRPTVIHRGWVEIHLPQRWVKKYKVIELPKGVTKVELVDERPEFAYPVA